MADKRMSLTRRDFLHVEAPGCIINIRCDLADRDGRPVVSVEVLADGDRYAGDPQWWIDGKAGDNSARSCSLRVVRTD